MSSTESPGLYIHVPFCRTKCPYCDFYSVPSLSAVHVWAEALCKEIVAYKDRSGVFGSLYLGGGTPSVLEERELALIFERLFSHFSFSPDAEVTFEANPDDVTEKKLALLKSCGITRISLGVQSLDEGELRALGRRHTAEQARRAVEKIRAGGFSNVSVDLMYGLPGQTASQWMNTLKSALEYRPEHLSCYQLTFHEGTPFGRMLQEGRIGRLNEEEQRLFFLMTAETLESSGYRHYEISNFARGEGFVSRHNRKYWRRVPYIGLGPGAHSFWGGIRWWNESSVTSYCEALKGGRLPIQESEALTDEQQRIESLCLGLRTSEGVDLPLLRTYPGFEKVLSRLEDDNLVQVCGDRIIPTREGFAVADSLPMLFL
ncbi:MAG: coproporphyrinogen III oxidase [Deltaproteobacteria bacterium HGW-Deltaproteobacteria-15]|jgi:oxygen-independent coproporphyrinogen-3 oxidase|nr:MAG: coproporphyrinogen III oxidase [Deltaproteobacteria bacterium HGW-Deltaproteobacteria-15]